MSVINLASIELGTKVFDCSSEVKGCEAIHLLDNQLSTIWLTENDLPQWVCFSLKDIHLIRDTVIRTLGWHCWHAYSTNPKRVTVYVSNDGTKYKTWGTFQSKTLRPGTHLFPCAPINVSIYPFISFEFNQTFGGRQTYMNRIFLYSDELSASLTSNENEIKAAFALMSSIPSKISDHIDNVAGSRDEIESKSSISTKNTLQLVKQFEEALQFDDLKDVDFSSSQQVGADNHQSMNRIKNIEPTSEKTRRSNEGSVPLLIHTIQRLEKTVSHLNSNLKQISRGESGDADKWIPLVEPRSRSSPLNSVVSEKSINALDSFVRPVKSSKPSDGYTNEPQSSISSVTQNYSNSFLTSTRRKKSLHLNDFHLLDNQHPPIVSTAEGPYIQQMSQYSPSDSIKSTIASLEINEPNYSSPQNEDVRQDASFQFEILNLNQEKEPSNIHITQLDLMDQKMDQEMDQETGSGRERLETIQERMKSLEEKFGFLLDAIEERASIHPSYEPMNDLMTSNVVGSLEDILFEVGEHQPEQLISHEDEFITTKESHPLEPDDLPLHPSVGVIMSTLDPMVQGEGSHPISTANSINNLKVNAHVLSGLNQLENKVMRILNRMNSDANEAVQPASSPPTNTLPTHPEKLIYNEKYFEAKHSSDPTHEMSGIHLDDDGPRAMTELNASETKLGVPAKTHHSNQDDQIDDVKYVDRSSMRSNQKLDAVKASSLHDDDLQIHFVTKDWETNVKVKSPESIKVQLKIPSVNHKTVYRSSSVRNPNHISSLHPLNQEGGDSGQPLKTSYPVLGESIFDLLERERNINSPSAIEQTSLRFHEKLKVYKQNSQLKKSDDGRYPIELNKNALEESSVYAEVIKMRNDLINISRDLYCTLLKKIMKELQLSITEQIEAS